MMINLIIKAWQNLYLHKKKIIKFNTLYFMVTTNGDVFIFFFLKNIKNNKIYDIKIEKAKEEMLL